jgi:hypothetical protein
MRPVTVFKGSKGINNKIDPTRLEFSARSGITELAYAVNVDIDDSGGILRRGGYALLATGKYGNLFSLGDTAIGTKDGYIGLIGSDLVSFTPLSAVTSGARVSYADMGLQVFYANGYEKGIIKNGSHSAWVAGSYVGPDTNKTYEDPPLGHLICLYNGHMYIARTVGGYHVIQYSGRFAYSWFDFASDYLPWPSRIKMMLPVVDGIYVGVGAKAYFLQGPIPREFAIREVAQSSVYEGSAVKVPAAKLGIDLPGDGVIWGSPEGIFFGGAEGLVINLTEKNLTLPSGSEAVGFYSGEKYFCMVEQ